MIIAKDKFWDNSENSEHEIYSCGNCIHSEDVIVGGEIFDVYCWVLGTYRHRGTKYYKCKVHNYGGTKRYDSV